MLATQGMPNMVSGSLFVSFWHICLDNIPEGIFTHTRISSVTARKIIDEARLNNKLLCVTESDLFAPYNSRERDSHAEFCSVLSREFQIQLTLENFASQYEVDGHKRSSINPLNFAHLSVGTRLLVINCCYSSPRIREEGGLEFRIAQSSVEFSLFEAVSGAATVRNVDLGEE